MMVDVLIVTYGKRWLYLEKVIARLLEQSSVRQITIVNNHADYDLKIQTEQFRSDKIIVLDLEKNYGSAYGFKYGLTYLLNQIRSNLILLLDDDNLPEPDCIDKLINYWDQLNDDDKESNTMLLALRPDRPYLNYAAKGIRIKLFFPLNNHFLGFNLFRPDIWLLKKFFPRKLIYKPDQVSVSIPCAPYGGLFFHKKLLLKNGMPDKRFFTYADDFDFTYRHVNHQGTILLLPGCRINDLDIPFVNQKKQGLFNPKFLQMEHFRLFYLMRNTMFFTKQYFVTNRIIFAVNRIVYSTYLFFLALLYGKIKTFLLFNSAVSRGLKGGFEKQPVQYPNTKMNSLNKNE